MRLDKFLAHNGFGSRKDAKKLVKDGLVLVNEELVSDASMLINIDSDTVSVEDEVINYKEQVYYMLNKPAGYISSHDEEMYPSVFSLIDDNRPDLIIVGRLDVDTEGLLLITSDGKFSHQVAHGKKSIFKQYYVELERDFDKAFIAKLAEGIIIDEHELKPAKVEMIDDKSLLLSIAEGKFHQVKKMMQYCNNEVMYLKREKIGNLALGENLEMGQYRELTDQDIENIYKV